MRNTSLWAGFEVSRCEALILDGYLDDDHLEAAVIRDMDPNLKNKRSGFTILQCAVDYDRAVMVDRLLARGADPNMQDRNGVTALMYAVRKSTIAVTEALLRAGADVHPRDKWGSTALMRAAEVGNWAAVELLQLSYFAQGHSLGVDEIQALRSNNMPVIQPGAAWPDLVGQQDLDVLKEIEAVLSKNGADLEARDHYGRTPLLRAASHGFSEAAAALLMKGARLDVQDNDGQTPLVVAARGGHVTALKVLLAHGADLNVQNKAGQTSLMVAAVNNRVEALEILLGAGAALDLRDEEGQNALMVAADYGRREAAEVLLRSYRERGCSLSREERQVLERNEIPMTDHRSRSGLRAKFFCWG